MKNKKVKIIIPIIAITIIIIALVFIILNKKSKNGGVRLGSEAEAHPHDHGAGEPACGADAGDGAVQHLAARRLVDDLKGHVLMIVRAQVAQNAARRLLDIAPEGGDRHVDLLL